ncbi:MAG: GlsB/YeaQ/YmgE family stress response membrane protein [Chloroflexota bacterium]
MNFFDLDPIGWALVGFLAGGLSSTLIRGRAARGCLSNILVGILGGLIGGTLAKGAGIGDAGGFLGSIFVALFGSVLLRLAIEFVDRRPHR